MLYLEGGEAGMKHIDAKCLDLPKFCDYCEEEIVQGWNDTSYEYICSKCYNIDNKGLKGELNANL